MFNRESRSQPRMQTLIGPTVRVHGDVEFTGGMHIDGHVFGGVRVFVGNHPHQTRGYFPV